jgi:chromosome segregation ATPase
VDHHLGEAMIVDQELFPAPKSKPAKQLVKLRARRLDLQRRAREALLARDRAQTERDRLEQEVNAAEARALALERNTDTRSDRARLADLADEVEDHDRTHTAIVAGIDAVDDEIRRVARDEYASLLDEVVASHDHAREEIGQALELIADAHGRARSAYASAQALTANAGDLGQRVELRDVPPVEQIVAEGGLDPLIRSVFAVTT